MPAVARRCRQTPEACERFDVRGVGLKSGVFIGIVTLRSAVDFEAEKHFDVSIKATDNGKRESKSKQIKQIKSRSKSKQVKAIKDRPKYVSYVSSTCNIYF